MIRIDGLYTRATYEPILYIVIGNMTYMTTVMEYRELNMSDLQPCAYPVSAIK